MLQITIPAVELFDETHNEFITTEEQTLQLEHSLVALSKWESRWHKAFLTGKEKTNEETLDYIRCMTVTPNVDPKTFLCLSQDNLDQIDKYIQSPMTATVFSENKNSKGSKEVVTAEVVYHWMIALNIPPEYDKWHLNRLLTLIRVCEIKNSPPKKMGKRETMSRNAALNAANRKRFNSRG